MFLFSGFSIGNDLWNCDCWKWSDFLNQCDNLLKKKNLIKAEEWKKFLPSSSMAIFLSDLYAVCIAML